MVQFSLIYWKLLFFTLLIIYFCNAAPSKQIYEEGRNELIEKEAKEAFGGKLKLEGNEVEANECLMQYKKLEIDYGFKHPTEFLPAENFLKVRNNIESSKVFEIIRMAPKGGIFHIHSAAISTPEYLIREMTYEPNLYICINDKKQVRFKFMSNKGIDTSCNWRLLSDVRKSPTENIDKTIMNALSLMYQPITNINDIWEEFEGIFDSVKGLITYRPLFTKFFIAAMQECYDDNVMFMELRTTGSALYELDGTVYSQKETIKIYQDITEQFKKTHPRFFGTKMIYSPFRKLPDKTFDDQVRKYKELKDAFPDYVLGFDLVGQEDKGNTLHSYADKLKDLSSDKKYANFFFHAGETNWYGLSTDENLYDAILLNTKRIGHGYALLKHPKLMQIVKERKIAIELNPISNQVLKLVEDMRNHPGSYFFATDMPVVVSSDDPGFWHAKGLTYDFYEVFMGMMSRNADLRALKQLALNSITYSGFSANDQEKILHSFYADWENFLIKLINNPLCNNHISTTRVAKQIHQITGVKSNDQCEFLEGW